MYLPSFFSGESSTFIWLASLRSRRFGPAGRVLATANSYRIWPESSSGWPIFVYKIFFLDIFKTSNLSSCRSAVFIKTTLYWEKVIFFLPIIWSICSLLQLGKHQGGLSETSGGFPTSWFLSFLIPCQHTFSFWKTTSFLARTLPYSNRQQKVSNLFKYEICKKANLMKNVTFIFPLANARKVVLRKLLVLSEFSANNLMHFCFKLFWIAMKKAAKTVSLGHSVNNSKNVPKCLLTWLQLNLHHGQIQLGINSALIASCLHPSSSTGLIKHKINWVLSGPRMADSFNWPTLTASILIRCCRSLHWRPQPHCLSCLYCSSPPPQTSPGQWCS